MLLSNEEECRLSPEIYEQMNEAQRAVYIVGLCAVKCQIAELHRAQLKREKK